MRHRLTAFHMKAYVAGLLFIVSFAAPAAEAPGKPDLFEEALAISGELDPKTDLPACRTAFKECVARAQKALEAARKEAPGQALDAKQTVDVLNRELLIDRKVTYISNQYWRDSLFTSALMKKRGNCLATSLLYYLVARELKLPITMAFAPRHAFVRWEDGISAFNIETTKSGKVFTDDVCMEVFDLAPEDLKPNAFACRLDEARARAMLLGNWAAVMFSLQRRDKANALLAQALELEPDNQGLRLLHVNFLMIAGKVEDAALLLQAILGEKKGGPWAAATSTLAYSDYLYSRGRADDAIDLLQRNFPAAPMQAKLRMLSRLGELYRHRRDFDRAIKIHKLQARLDPGEDSYNALGSVLTEAHQDAEAIAAYEKVLAYNPEDFFAKVILAGLYERSGDKAKGRAYFAKIKEPRGNKATWLGALVWYYANIKEPALMLRNMEAALNLDGSGLMYQYFVREPDLDPYRTDAAFVKLMKAHAPTEKVMTPKEPQPAANPGAQPEPEPEPALAK